VKSQNKHVKNLKRKSLWSKNLEEVSSMWFCYKSIILRIAGSVKALVML
jgi:hypothetical protein